jgi:hypothetical protein
MRIPRSRIREPSAVLLLFQALCAGEAESRRWPDNISRLPRELEIPAISSSGRKTKTVAGITAAHFVKAERVSRVRSGHSCVHERVGELDGEIEMIRDRSPVVVVELPISGMPKRARGRSRVADSFALPIPGK